MRSLSPDETFQFGCHPQVPCFNECCRDLNQFLMPYDILRLKRGLDLDSDVFLKRFTRQHIGPRSGLPVITLTPGDPVSLICPFVTADGCRVYENRPSSCRTYPLARVLSRRRTSGETEASYLLLEEPHCRGFEQPGRPTLTQWINDQKIKVYNRFNDPMLEIISLKNQLLPGPLDPAAQQLFRLACYDLDTFRKAILENRLPGAAASGKNLIRAAGSDDEALLMESYRFVKIDLFGEGPHHGA